MVKSHSLHETKQIINELENKTSHLLTWKALKDKIDKLTNGGLMQVGYPMPKGQPFFRGRCFKILHLVNNISELLCKPKKSINNYGRCHIPEQQVLYTAFNLDTVLCEISPNIGDIVQVAVLMPDNEYNNLQVTAIGEVDHVRRSERPMIGNTETIKKVRDFIGYNSNTPTEESGIKILIDAYLSNMFRQPANKTNDYNYKLSSALSNIIFENCPFDGFAYPSVQNLGGLNYAFKHEALDKMKVDECMAFEITDNLGYGIYGRTQIARSTNIDPNGNIKWQYMQAKVA